MHALFAVVEPILAARSVFAKLLQEAMLHMWLPLSRENQPFHLLEHDPFLLEPDDILAICTADTLIVLIPALGRPNPPAAIRAFADRSAAAVASSLLVLRSMRLSETYLKPCLRGFSLCIVALTAVVIGYSSEQNPPQLLFAGGLHSCFHCGSGWNWHVLLFVLAYALAAPESVMALTSPLLGRCVNWLC